MQALTAHDVLDLWERAAELSPTTVALAALAAADRQVCDEALAALPLGHRDRRLLAVRELTLGPNLRSRATCPCCGVELEFTLDNTVLPAAPPAPPTTGPTTGIVELHRRTDRQDEPPGGGEPSGEPGIHELASDGLRLRFRLLTSADLLAVESSADAETARRLLIHRCLVEAERDGLPVESEELTEQELALLAESLAAADPGAEVLLDCRCAACGQNWLTTFDLAAFFAEELAALARGLLAEVHALARSYCWSEAEILAMSARRRRVYLEMLGA